MTIRDTLRLLALLLSSALVLASPSPMAGSISVAWDPVSDNDLAGYFIEHGILPDSYTIQVDAGLATQHTLTGLTDCTVHYVAVKAYDQASNLSTNFSNEISGWPRPTVSAASPSTAEQGRTLDLVVNGTNFQSGAQVEFTDSNIVVNSVSVTSCTQLTVNVTVGNGSAVGTNTVTVINTDQTFGETTNLFTVAAAVAPTVTGTSPVDGATQVSIAVQPTVSFSEPVDPATVTAASVLLVDSGGNPVAQTGGSPALSGDGLTATITPAGDLALGQTYRLRVIGATGVQDLAGHPVVSTFTQSSGFSTSGDTTPPVISSVTSGSVGSTSVVVTWTTNEDSDGQVFYRETGQTVYQQTILDSQLVQSHSVTLQGLTPNTGYEYHVRSADGAGNETTSSDANFATGNNSFVYLRFETEAGELTAPVRAMSGGGAFADGWIDVPLGTLTGSANNPAGTAVFGFQVPTADTWFLWVRLSGDTLSGDSWYESVDGAARQNFYPSTLGVWEWVPGRPYDLSAGLHSLELGGRDGGARADRVLLTNDPGFVPTEQPGADTSAPASPSGASATPTAGAVGLGWTNPPDGDLDRVVIRFRSDGVYPVSPVDGFALVDRPATSGGTDGENHTGLVNGTTYLYSIFAVDAAGNVSPAARVEATPFDNAPPAAVQNLRRTDTVGGSP